MAYRNGYPKDSATYKPDGSGVHIGWFDNGNPSFAGVLAAGFQKNGRWQFYHKNGHLSAVEIYDHGKLINKQYFDEQGNAMTDTSNTDRAAVYRTGLDDWGKYLDHHLHWPNNYTIVHSDAVAVVVSFSVDEDGKVVDPYVSIPFHTAFDKIALDAILHSPAWKPAMDHNRRIRSEAHQPVVFKQPD